MNTITDNQGNVYKLVPYETMEEDSEGYQTTVRHGFILKPVES